MSQIYTIKIDNDGPDRFKLVLCDFDGMYDDISHSNCLEELAYIRDERIKYRKFLINHLKICLTKEGESDECSK